MIILRMHVMPNSPVVFDIIIETCKFNSQYGLSIWTVYNTIRTIFSDESIFEFLKEWTKMSHRKIRKIIEENFDVTFDRYNRIFFNTRNKANEFLEWIESLYVLNKLTEK